MSEYVPSGKPCYWCGTPTQSKVRRCGRCQKLGKGMPPDRVPLPAGSRGYSPARGTAGTMDAVAAAGDDSSDSSLP